MSGGVLLAGTQVRIVDERRQDLEERRVGEIAIHCDSLFTGYFRDPETTAKSLADGWYYSGTSATSPTATCSSPAARRTC